MSGFNNAGSFTIAPGASFWVGACRDSNDCTHGKNEGAQIVEADPNNDGTPGNLQCGPFSKQIDYREFFGATGEGDTKTAYWTYWVLVTNIGSAAKNFTLQGGGFS